MCTAHTSVLLDSDVWKNALFNLGYVDIASQTNGLGKRAKFGLAMIAMSTMCQPF